MDGLAVDLLHRRIRWGSGVAAVEGPRVAAVFGQAGSDGGFPAPALEEEDDQGGEDEDGGECDADSGGCGGREGGARG